MTPSILKKFEMTCRAFERGEDHIVIWRYITKVQVRNDH